MSLYEAYLKDIEEREKIGLSPKPIDNGDLINEIITNIVKKKVNTEIKASSSLYIIHSLAQLRQH